VPFDRTPVRLFSFVLDCNYTSVLHRFWDISTYLQKNKRSFCDPKCTPYCRTLRRVMQVLFRFNLQPNLKLVAQSAPKIWSGPQNAEMGHVTLSTPTCGIIRYRKTNTSRGNYSVRNLKSLALVVPEIFQGVQNSKKMCHLILTTPTRGTVIHHWANISRIKLVYKIWSL